ncbi:hypothetical protein KM043_014880 [Ampulex compressa]|nr:hypothetical protein KM043_014880 [Ampulex compressa]
METGTKRSVEEEGYGERRSGSRWRKREEERRRKREEEREGERKGLHGAQLVPETFGFNAPAGGCGYLVPVVAHLPLLLIFDAIPWILEAARLDPEVGFVLLIIRSLVHPKRIVSEFGKVLKFYSVFLRLEKVCSKLETNVQEGC